MKCDFSIRHYKEILSSCLEEGYEFIDFRGSDKKSIILRHDIDYSLKAALDLAKIDKELGIRSTFFVLLDGPYNIFKEQSKIKRIIEMGHWMGFHYRYSSETDVIRKLKTLENYFGREIKVIAQHNPSISRSMAIKETKLLDAYSLRFTKDIKYLSDSCQHWREGCLCTHINKHKHFQVLTHPILWTESALDIRDILVQLRDMGVREVESEFFFLFNNKIIDSPKNLNIRRI